MKPNFVAVVAVFSLTAAAVARPPLALADDPSVPEKILTVERIYATPPITGEAPSAVRWLPDGKGVSYLVEQDGETQFVTAAVPSGETAALTLGDLEPPGGSEDDDDEEFSFSSYDWTPGGLVFFTYDGDIFTLDPKDGDLQRRTESEVSEENVTVSPDGGMFAFTREHDLFAMDLDSGDVIQITDTGTDSLLNGVLDWAYMEELFTRGDVQGYWWSPDSRRIAFLQIDESPVHTFPIVDFIPTYNTAQMQHYPKSGSEIPIVRVAVFDLDSGETTWIDLDTSDDSYIARLNWLGDSRRIALEKLNRDQDDLTLYLADVTNGEVTAILEESKDTWVNVTYMKHFYESKDRFVFSSERDGHAHLYLFNSAGKMLGAVTNGDWEVSSLDAVDEKRGQVFFTGLERSILERHIYRVSEKGGRPTRLSQAAGTHYATFSPDARYYVDRYSSTEMPWRLSVHSASDGKRLFVLAECDTSELASYHLPRPHFFTITSREGIEFYCSMIKPADFDPSRRYPVIVYTYGGPHAQEVRDRWGGSRYLWHAFMAQRGYIIFTLDNRGSYGRGVAWEDPILRHLGQVELEDQLAGVDYLKTLPYVDATRIGIWGWSYGGFMTSMAMFKAPGVFNAGAAVAPVTDWRFYDAIYTERYMKQPDDNEDGYHDSAPINFVNDLEGRFLLMHGTSDDNVHMANSIRLVHELITAGKDFELMVYPRKTHGITGRDSRVHLFRRLTRFFDENL